MGQNPNPKQGGFYHAATQNLCRSFSGLTGQAVSDLMEQHGLDYNYSGTPEAAKEADQ